MEEEEGVKIKRIKKHDDDRMVVDRISELPEFIIHHILSFLDSPREVTKTSVLSKRWYHHIWGSLPELNFLEDQFCQGSASSMTTTVHGHSSGHYAPVTRQPLRGSAKQGGQWVGEMEVGKDLQALRLKFVNFVDKTLLRYQINRFRINKFCLRTTLDLDDSHLASLVEKWIKFVVVQNQIEELDLQLGTWYTNAIMSLSLPQKSFFSGSKSLKVLKLHGCSVGSSCCRDHQIAFRSLKILCLELIRFYDNQVLDYIISTCPLLEEIILRHCRGLKKLQLYDLVKLRSVEVTLERNLRPELELIDIKALSLESFSFNNGVHSTIARFEMAACKNLKALYLGGITTKNWPFQDFITQFPILEVLVLDSCMTIETITISSSFLKSFRLIRCGKVMEIEIEAPNLLSFQYEGDILPRISSTNTCGEWEAILDCTGFGGFDRRELRNFLSYKLFNVFTLLLRFDRFCRLNNWLPFSSLELGHLKLEILHLSSNYPAVLDGLLRGFRPRMVTLRVTYELANWPYRTDFIKYLYEKLMDMAHSCCDDGYMSYIPKHNANKVEIEISERASSRGRATELNVLLNILPTIEGQVIQFRICRLDV